MAQTAVRRRAGMVQKQLEQLGRAGTRLLGVDRGTVRRWRSGELTPSALARAFVGLLVLLQKGGLDLGALARGRVQVDPYGPLAPPRWDEEPEDVEAPASVGGALKAVAIAEPSGPLEASQQREAQKGPSVAVSGEPVHVKVLHRDGGVEDVTVARAALLVDMGQAEPAGKWSRDECRAVLDAHELRQARIAERLDRDGLLINGRLGPVSEPRPRFWWRW